MIDSVVIDVPYVYRVVGYEDRGRKRRNFDLVGRAAAVVPCLGPGSCAGYTLGRDEACIDVLVHDGRLYVEAERTVGGKGPLTLSGARLEAEALAAALVSPDGPSIRVGRCFYAAGTRSLAFHVGEIGGVRTAPRLPFRAVDWTNEGTAAAAAVAAGDELVVLGDRIYTSRFEPVAVRCRDGWDVEVCDRRDYASGVVGRPDRFACRLDRCVAIGRSDMPAGVFGFPDLEVAWLRAAAEARAATSRRTAFERDERIRVLDPRMPGLLAALLRAADDGRGAHDADVRRSFLDAWSAVSAAVAANASAGVEEFMTLRLVLEKLSHAASWLSTLTSMRDVVPPDEDDDAIAAIG